MSFSFSSQLFHATFPRVPQNAYPKTNVRLPVEPLHHAVYRVYIIDRDDVPYDDVIDACMAVLHVDYLAASDLLAKARLEGRVTVYEGRKEYAKAIAEELRAVSDVFVAVARV